MPLSPRLACQCDDALRVSLALNPGYNYFNYRRPA